MITPISPFNAAQQFLFDLLSFANTSETESERKRYGTEFSGRFIAACGEAADEIHVSILTGILTAAKSITGMFSNADLFSMAKTLFATITKVLGGLAIVSKLPNLVREIGEPYDKEGFFPQAA